MACIRSFENLHLFFGVNNIQNINHISNFRGPHLFINNNLAQQNQVGLLMLYLFLNLLNSNFYLVIVNSSLYYKNYKI